jgi:hypothetical protein
MMYENYSVKLKIKDRRYILSFINKIRNENNFPCLFCVFKKQFSGNRLVSVSP